MGVEIRGQRLEVGSVLSTCGSLTHSLRLAESTFTHLNPLAGF